MDDVSIKRLTEEGIFSYTDVHFAQLMVSESEQSDALFLAAALASSQTRFGNICLDLDETAGLTLFSGEETVKKVTCPELDNWLSVLKKSAVVGSPGDFTPLILEDDKRLYLHRYWQYQETLAGFIRRSAAFCVDLSESEKKNFSESMKRLFPVSGNGNDWQKIAAVVSLLKKFSVISGGPGTGKTTTITKILALLIEQHDQKKGTADLRISLAAPTGKAAARLSESISDAKQVIDCSDEIKYKIPEDAATIHRLLGSIKNSPYFRYNAENRLPVDIVIVDEASMVDLALMSKLTSAIPDSAKLILLGDQDQLASVEAGAVLADICNTGRKPVYSDRMRAGIRELTGEHLPEASENDPVSDLGDSIVVLQKSYRFGNESGIKAVSQAVNNGNTDLFSELSASGGHEDFLSSEYGTGNEFDKLLKTSVLKYFGPVFTASSVSEKLKLFERFRLLCAVRKGSYGVEALNLMIEKILRQAGFIASRDSWYPGRPVMITRNDYQNGLFNGDIGITVPTEEDPALFDVCFFSGEGTLKRVRNYNLPECETVYAMTVHKSQGSEFDSVLFVLPTHDTRVLTRELIYTGITRARKFVEIKGDSSIIQKAIKRKTIRSTGLREALWEGSAEEEIKQEMSSPSSR